ncbi:META domain-containing protein [uncultured Methanospirillum sp.]|uniref:META domain-containing protein n=1 Tax=uncultured Methanospirillum sp. TaxID=262503 RepID=UPI00374A6FA3
MLTLVFLLIMGVVSATNMETEQIFLKLLEAARTYKIEDQKVSLSDTEGNSLLFIKSEKRESKDS